MGFISLLLRSSVLCREGVSQGLSERGCTVMAPMAPRADMCNHTGELISSGLAPWQWQAWGISWCAANTHPLLDTNRLLQGMRRKISHWGKCRLRANDVGEAEVRSSSPLYFNRKQKGILFGCIRQGTLTQHCSCGMSAYSWWLCQLDPTHELEELEKSCIHCWWCGGETAAKGKMETKLPILSPLSNPSKSVGALGCILQLAFLCELECSLITHLT